MRICILAAGAGGMYCGSCLRDSALAVALRRAGHEVTLVPLYTPLTTDGENVSIGEVFYGGINAYLQYASRLFRHTPRWMDWLFNRPGLLKLAGDMGAQTSPAKLGPFTLSILEGERGPQVKELRRLLRFMKEGVRPEVVSLPNLMFIGVARMIGEELGAPVVCELTGEDIFLDALVEPYRSRAQEMIRERCGDVARFVATSNYYAERMADYLGVSRERIDVVYPGVPMAEGAPADRSADKPLTIGYLARLAPEKGLDRLIDAFLLLQRIPGMQQVRLRVAGFLGAGNKRWYAEQERRIRREGLGGRYEYLGAVDREAKLAFLDSLDVMSVPTAYAEPKGMYVLEALSRGVPVVQPDHGAFGELIERTGGGRLVRPGDPQALAHAIRDVLSDRMGREDLGRRGQRAIGQAFSVEHMAANMLRVYESVQPCPQPQAS